ncbi:MAG: glycosyltransferase [Steroidobacterales bacterium]
MNIEIISATRYSAADFQKQSALALSLQRMSQPNIILRAQLSNTRGLPAIYNEGLQAASPDSIVVFMHDDVWIEDYFFARRLIEGLSVFDVVGLAGNRRRIPGQPGWGFVDRNFTHDTAENLSGWMAHGQQPGGPVVYYGHVPAACELLDGVLLAAKRSVLVANSVTFDTRFEFHCYDMDFCRAARQKGLKLGTWPIAITHQSDGVFGAGNWHQAYAAYIAKWGS